MAFFEIPLTPSPQDITVRLKEIEYRFHLRYWDADEGGWTLDIFDLNETCLVAGVPLVTGANLMEQFTDVNIGGGLWVSSALATEPTPTFANLGSTVKLYFGDVL